MGIYKRVDLTQEPEEETTTKATENPVKEIVQIEEAILDQIAMELEDIAQGISKLTPYAIQDKNIPTMHVLQQLRKNPTKDLIEKFLQIAAQDYGKRAADHFKARLEKNNG